MISVVSKDVQVPALRSIQRGVVTYLQYCAKSPPSHLTRPTPPIEGPNESRQQCWLVTWGLRVMPEIFVCVCVSVLIYGVWGLSSPVRSCVAVYEIKKPMSDIASLLTSRDIPSVEMTAWGKFWWLSVCRYWRRFHATRRMQTLKNWDGSCPSPISWWVTATQLGFFW